MTNRVIMRNDITSKNTSSIGATALLNEYESVRELATTQLQQAGSLLLEISQMKAAAVCWVSSHGVRLIGTCGLGENLLARSLPKSLGFFAPEEVCVSQDRQTLQTIEAYLGIEGYQSVISLPLLAYSKQVMGAILLLDQKPLELAQGQLTQLADLVRLVMQGINATRAAKIIPRAVTVPKLEQAVLQSKESVIAFDLAGAIQTWNCGATEIYGYSSSAMLGQHYKCLLPSDKIASFQNALRQLQFEKIVFPCETTRIHQSGFRVQVRSSLHLVRNEDGTATGFIEYSGLPNLARDEADLARDEAPKPLQNSEHTFKNLSSSDSNLLVLPHIEAALAFMGGVGGVNFFTASFEQPAEWNSKKLVLRGRGFMLVVLEADLAQLPSQIKIT
jgi:PAS domain S-box-containing protein